MAYHAPRSAQAERIPHRSQSSDNAIDRGRSPYLVSVENKVLPSPGGESIQIRPLWFSTIRWQIACPMSELGIRSGLSSGSAIRC